MNIIDLPYECLYIIFDYLRANDIISLRKVCTVFRNVVKYIKCEDDVIRVSNLHDIYYNEELIYGFVNYNMRGVVFPKGILEPNNSVHAHCTGDITRYNGIKILNLYGANERYDLSVLRDIKHLTLGDCTIENVVLGENNGIKSLSFLRSRQVKTITNGDQLNHLDISGTSVSDVSSFKNLTRLDADDTEHLKVIRDLDKLVILNANDSDLLFIVNLPNVEFISCNGSNVINIIEAPKLRKLNARSAILRDVYGLNNLESLNIYHSNSRNISGLTTLHKLKYLNMNGTNATKTFEGLGHVEEILCSGNINDINKLTDTKYLSLRNYEGKTISNLPNLVTLNMEECSTSEIISLRRLKCLKMKKCEVTGLYDLPKLITLEVEGYKGECITKLPNLRALKVLGDNLIYVTKVPKLISVEIESCLYLSRIDLTDNLNTIKVSGSPLFYKKKFDNVPNKHFE